MLLPRWRYPRRSNDWEVNQGTGFVPLQERKQRLVLEPLPSRSTISIAFAHHLIGGLSAHKAVSAGPGENDVVRASTCISGLVVPR